jgi:hypothetical protein
MTGITPEAKKIGLYEKWSTTMPVVSMKSIPPKPDPMLAMPNTVETEFRGKTSEGRARIF